MTNSELIAALSDPAAIRKRAFDLLKEIIRRRSLEVDANLVQELILRALENREHFGSATKVLDALVRDVGLFPYLNPDKVGLADRIAIEIHRGANLEQVVFHHPQAKVFHAIMSGKSVVLSAPTSFGKSLIIDAVVSTHKFSNIVIVVPTLALVDETRRRMARFRGHYKVITQVSQKPGTNNIFVLTQERVVNNPGLAQVDFFVIDEFYKLSPLSGEDERCALLNQAFYELSKRCKHFYLLGPGIRALSDEFQHAVSCLFFHEPYQTVVSELHQVSPGEKPLERLKELSRKLSDSTLVFCSSPEKTQAVAVQLPESSIDENILDATSWIGEHYHPEWQFATHLQRGIGIHHGRIPRALAQLVVRLFNEDQLRFLVCTSTLIEGVNTKAKNIVVFDHTINNKAIDLFTFNNIRGRSGRMFRHFVGHVWVFHPPPQEELPFVDVPVFTQSDEAPESLLVQLDEDDLTDGSEERIRQFKNCPDLNFETIRANVGIDPSVQIAIAQAITEDVVRYAGILSWDRLPRWPELLGVCEIASLHRHGTT